MDIIAKSVPGVNRGDILSSVEELRNYMVEVFEIIDYTLSNQGGIVRGAVSEDNFQILSNTVAALGSTLSNLSSTVSAQAETLKDLQKQIDSLDERVKALENP